MATQNDFTRAFNSPLAAMSAFNRVQISANGAIFLADTAVRGIGVLQEDVQGASWENPDVRLWGTGTVQILATAGPVTAGNTLYLAAAGKVAPTGTITAGIAVTGLAGVSGALEMYPQFDL